MKRFLIPGLIVTHLLLDGLFFWMRDSGSRIEGQLWYLPVAVSMVVASQGALLAIWIALGGGRSCVRVILATVGAVVVLGCFHQVQLNWMWLPIDVMGCVTAFLLLARLTGLVGA